MHLADIGPKTKGRVIDLVRLAGVNVDDWSNWSGGAADAARNPRYCYEWSFVEPNKVVVLNLWFRTMRFEGGKVIYRITSTELEAVEGTKNPSIWTARSRKIEAAIRSAYEKDLPIRVIICDGDQRQLQDPDAAASKVKFRALDPLIWGIASHNSATGEWILERGKIPVSYADQFDLPEVPTHKEVTSIVYDRCPRVRAEVRARSGGNCEYCGKAGFRMPDGRIYIETHHIIPLFERGSDTIANVIALCPDHHREAHYGASAMELRNGFQQLVLARL